MRLEQGKARSTPRAVTHTAWLFALLAISVVLAAQVPRGESFPPSDQKITFGTRVKVQGVPNFGKVTETLYRGAQPTREGFTNLREMGVNIVVDLRGARGERELVTQLGMQYVPLPWRCYHPKDEQFAKFLTLLRENPGQKVFVHCRMGDDRTGMEIAAYRMAEQGWTAADARKEMIAFGANWYHRTICPQLGPYVTQFPERFKTSPAFESLRTKTSHDSQETKP